ncbi:hypothetical protein ES703_108822 [subsurface metagenome]
MGIQVAFAVNLSNSFEPKHFGDANKYLIYKYTDSEFVFLKEEINRFKNSDENETYGSQKKGRAIIGFLKETGVQVLVSKQFGKNIQMVNKHFIPIIIKSEKPDEVISMLKKNIKWIEDELNNKPEEYKLFNIKNGVLKTIIKKE